MTQKPIVEALNWVPLLSPTLLTGPGVVLLPVLDGPLLLVILVMLLGGNAPEGSCMASQRQKLLVAQVVELL